MIGMIRPLVKGANQSTSWLRLLGTYWVGAEVSSTALGALLGLLGILLLPHASMLPALVLVGVTGAFLALADLGVGGTRTSTLRRQTCPAWWRRFGRARAVLLWGIDLGLGFTTVRVASLYWVVVMLVIVLASPVAGMIILGCYGLGLLANLSTGLFVLERRAGRPAAPVQALQLAPLLKAALAMVLLVWSALLLMMALRGI